MAEYSAQNAPRRRLREDVTDLRMDRWTDGPTVGPIDGRTRPLIEMRWRIQKLRIFVIALAITCTQIGCIAMECYDICTCLESLVLLVSGSLPFGAAFHVLFPFAKPGRFTYAHNAFGCD